MSKYSIQLLRRGVASEIDRYEVRWQRFPSPGTDTDFNRNVMALNQHRSEMAKRRGKSFFVGIGLRSSRLISSRSRHGPATVLRVSSCCSLLTSRLDE